MVHIPEELARSIQAGDCVLWAGAGIGSLAGRPGWEALLNRLIPQCPEESRAALRELLDQGRLRTILSYVHRHLGDEPLVRVLEEVSDESAEESLGSAAKPLGRLPWRACLATIYADLVGKVFAHRGEDGKPPEVLAHNTVHHLSLREYEAFFVLKTPPTGRAMRADSVLFDLVEEIVRSRTVLFLGFEPDDPDLVQVLDLFERIGRGNRHFAILPYVSGPEAEEWSDRYGIEVVHAPDDVDIGQVVSDLASASRDVSVRPADVEGRLAVLDLTRAVRGVALRADLALDDALTVEVGWIEHLFQRVPTTGAATATVATLLRTGSIMLAHRRIERARKCFQQVVSSGVEGEMMTTARFNLAMTALVEGDRASALEGLRAAAETDRSLAIVPPRFEILEVHGLSGTQILLTCRDRSSAEEVDVEVSTLSRPVGIEEQSRFSGAVQKLVGIEHRAVCRAKGGFADGRLFGVMYERSPGFALHDTLEGAPMSLDKAWELIEPLIAGLKACHAKAVLHRNLNPHHILLGPEGAMLRGFGFPPIIGFTRPSVRRENLGFLAPEVLGEGDASPQSDTYALAAVLYRVLTGRVPLGSVTAASTLVPDLDGRLDALFEGALHADPQQRMGLTELHEKLEHIVKTPEEGKAEPGREQVLDVPDMVARTPGVPVAVQSAHSTTKIDLPEDPNDLEAWTWILERKPMHLEARAALDRIEEKARQEGRWDRVADVLQVRVQIAQIKADRVRYLQELAVLLENELGAPASAFETLQTLLEEVDSTEQQPIVADLQRLAEVTGQWSPLVDSLTIVAGRVGDDDVQAGLYTELGKVYAERLGAPDRALAAYEQAIELQPTAERLLTVVPLHRKAGRVAELATSLLSLADLQEGEERHATLLDAARVLREDLGDEEGALGAVDVVLTDAPHHEAALVMAESLSRQLERWDTLVDVLSRRADASLDPEAASKWRKEAAQIAVEQLDDKQAAIELLEKVAQDDRGDRATAQQLTQLLRPIVASDPSRRPALIDALTLLVDLVESPDEKARLLGEAATLLDQEPDGRDRATDCRERIVELLPVGREESVRAAEALEKTYRRHERFDDLEELLRRQATDSDADEQIRARAWQKLLELHDGRKPDELAAIEDLEALTELEPTETQWRDDLLKRYLQREEYRKAGPLIRAQVFDEKNPKRKAELLLRGGILREQIGKIEGAVEALEEAVALDPERVEAWLALRDIYQETEQPLKAVEALARAAQYEQNRVEKVRMMFEAGQRYFDLGREQRALELLESVIHLDPDHREATQILLEHLIGDGQLKRAWPVAQTYVMQVHSQAPGDKKLNLRALSLAGRCALAVEDNERARDYLQKAKTLDATNLDVLRLLADLDMEAERWSDALRNYQSVVLGVGDKMSPGELSGVYVQMARARLGMEEKSKALQMLERAVEIDADNEDAVSSYVELGADVGGPAVLVKGKQRLADLLGRREEQTDEEGARSDLRRRRVGLLQEAAAVQLEQLSMPAEAIRTLEKVLELSPDDPAVLHRILDVFTQEQRWRDAVRVLERLAEAQADDKIRAKYLYAGAVLLRDNLLEVEQGDEWMQRVLDADPLHRRAFEAQVEKFRKNRAWSELSKVVRKRLKALSRDEDPKVMADLFEQVGDAHERMRDLETAVAAYDQAARVGAKSQHVEPEVSRQRRDRVIKLAIAAGEDQLDKAVHHAHAIIAEVPMDFEVYHRLVEIYLKQGDRDRARAVARTLKFLKQADEAEEELASVQPSQCRSPVQREYWRRALYHPYENPRLSDLLSIVWPMVAAREGRTHEHHGVERDDRIDVSLQSPTALARYIAHACQILDAPVPDLYLRKNDPGGLKIDALASGSGARRTVYPTVLAGNSAVGDKDETSMKFRAGRAIARVRPEHILAAVLPSTVSLRHAVYGAFRAARPDAAVPDDSRSAADAYAKQIGAYLQPARLDQLQALVEALSAEEINMRQWLQGVVYTATRAGFVLCDSIEVAAQILTRQGDEGAAITAKECIADLVPYSISEPYLKLRKQLGLSSR